MNYIDLDDYCVSPPFKALGVVFTENGCCSELPIIITAFTGDRNRLSYSCQCGCGGWCTNGHNTASEALAEYEKMTARHKEKKRGLFEITE